jgi:hypothetical protein
MSLRSFVKRPDVRAKLKPLRPKPPRTIGVPVKVQPRSNCYALVGTAFDYLLRFELQRRAPHSVAERWVAEYVPDRLYFRREFAGGSMEGSVVDFATLPVDPKGAGDPLRVAREAAEQARQIVERARVAFLACRGSRGTNHHPLFMNAHGEALANDGHWLSESRSPGIDPAGAGKPAALVRGWRRQPSPAGLPGLWGHPSCGSADGYSSLPQVSLGSNDGAWPVLWKSAQTAAYK